jgi:hypothetical protein
MVNHRLPYYWYIPFLGVAGMGSHLVAWLQGNSEKIVPARFLKAAAVLALLVVGGGQWRHQSTITRRSMTWVEGVTAENRRFVQSFQALPAPPPGSHVYFESVPRYFDPTAARSSAQVIFRDTSLTASLVTQCPPEGSCCLAVQNGLVVPKRWPGRDGP